jgi:hypothetical protein
LRIFKREGEMVMKRAVLAACVMAVLVLALPANADSITQITFDGLHDLQPVGDHYGQFGITFSSNALAVRSSLHGGIGNFTGNPSGNTILGFQTGSSVLMNVAGGFQNGLAFFYSAPNFSGTVTIWSGLNGTGTLLATISLGVTGTTGCANGSLFCIWTPVGLNFSGVAQSVKFSGKAGGIAFDSITLGSGVPSAVPEASTAFLMGIGLVALSCVGRLRRSSTHRG